MVTSLQYVVHGSRASSDPTHWRRSFINGYAWPSAIAIGSSERMDDSMLRPLPPPLPEGEGEDGGEEELTADAAALSRL